MTDDIRQEAVERAAQRLSVYEFPAHAHGDRHSLKLLKEEAAGLAIDASGLIDQLTEAIAQRDAMESRLVAVQQHEDSRLTLFEERDRARAQLAAEKALCDRLAGAYRAGLLGPPRARLLADYDALRATERET